MNSKLFKIFLVKKLKKIKNLIRIKNFKDKNYNKFINLKNYYLEWKKYINLKKKTKNLLKIEDIKILAAEDIKLYNKKIKIIKNNIKKFLINKKTTETLLEIKAGCGGEEAAIFANDLKRMYIKYFEKKKWKIKILSQNLTNFGGCKEVILSIKGLYTYNKLKFESGVHRVQRRPITENQNRIHTSTCKVAVIKKKTSKKYIIKKKDLIINTFKSSGPGGQHVNKTDSAIRIKHLPTGIVVECQNDRSQHVNKKNALKLINNKITIYNLNKNKKKQKLLKKALLGGGSRCEKIRTYNYCKNRITEHRINLKLNKLNLIMQGELDEILNKLKFFKKI